MASTEAPAPSGTIASRRRRDPALLVLAGLVAVAVAARPLVAPLVDRPGVQSWSTIFLAVTVQAVPFLALGVAVSAAIAAFLPPTALARTLPGRAALGVPVAALAGVALPGCECGSVPIARRLMARGAPPAVALTFLLAAPAVNPVVMVATAVAFPGQPRMVLARFLASVLAACVVGLVWLRHGRDEWLASGASGPTDSRLRRAAVFVETAQHDLLHAGGFLVVGAAAAATLQTIVPRTVLERVGGSGPLAIVALGLLAVVLAICSEADAFVAASLVQFSLVARLAFLTVGPMVDVKLIALQAGTFGRRFTVRFAPLTFVVAVVAAAMVGTLVL